MSLVTVLFLLCSGVPNEKSCKDNFMDCYNRMAVRGYSESYGIDACLVVQVKSCK